MPEVTMVVGDAKLKLMRWAKAMLAWHVIGAEVRGTWPRSAARLRAWWRAGKVRAKAAAERERGQREHCTAKGQNGKARKGIGREAQVALGKMGLGEKGIKGHVGRVAELGTKLMKGNVGVAKG